MAQIITGSEFENEVINSEIPVMVDFFADWCGPCKMIAGTIDEIAKETAGKAKVVKIDIDGEGGMELSAKYEIRSIPTIIFFKNGKIADRIVGILPKEVMLGKLNGLL